MRGRWPLLLEELGKLPRPFAVCYEASCGYGHLYERLSKVADRVVVAHPGRLAWIYKSKRKHDRVDATKLARLLLLGEVPAVHVPPERVRLWRQTIEFRQKLLGERVAAKNRTRSFLKERGLSPPRGLWSAKGLAWLGLGLDEGEALRRDLLLERLEESDRKVKRVSRYLDGVAAGHPGVALLRTIPGVGPRTAEALAAYLDDVRRFRGAKCVGAHLGLVPCQDASGDKSRLGHITRDGPATARKLLCEAAWVAVRRSPTVRDFYERVTRGDGGRKKIAIVATAHYLARVAAAMLRTGECWRERDGAKASGAAGGGGEDPSRPQGSSPPPFTAPGTPRGLPPPPLPASPSSPAGEEADGTRREKARRKKARHVTGAGARARAG